MDYEFQFAREQAISIAMDRVADMDQGEKTRLLDEIDQTLEQWKQEQTQTNGTIEVAPPPGDLRWLDLDDDGLSHKSEPFPAAKLRPEQCAGPFVQSKSDLFTKLWRDNYDPIRNITSKPTSRRDIAMALLVERDGDTMPAGSLASALLCIWTHVWVSREDFHKALTKKQFKDREQRSNAQANSVLANREKAGKLNAVIWEKAMAIDVPPP